jgi:hypothetical protein
VCATVEIELPVGEVRHIIDGPERTLVARVFHEKIYVHVFWVLFAVVIAQSHAIRATIADRNVA